jgi:hypothetical protein
MTVWLHDVSSQPGGKELTVIAVPGTVALEQIERNVAYSGLPAVQREILQDLRAKLDAGQLDGPQPDRKDLVGMGLARVVGVGHFEGMVQAAKEGNREPWAERPEAAKLSLLVDLAQEAGPPGAYTLSVIEREVDYDRLPPWRREMLEGLRERHDRGEFDGENPNPHYMGDRVNLALRLAELEARIEDYKHLGDQDRDLGRYHRWGDLLEEAKFDEIMWEIRALHLESEVAAYHILHREVDMARLPEEQRREFLEGRGAEQDSGGASEEPMPTGKEAEALYAEWREDYAARARELAKQDARQLMEAIGSLENRSGEATKPHPSPSEIAERNRGKPAAEKGQQYEKDRGRE